MLKTKENLNQLRTILNESITTAMAYKDNAILNLVRYHGLESAVFNLTIITRVILLKQLRACFREQSKHATTMRLICF
jgi:hypothetical protein